jgi:CTP:molybdopterin cytidylyltransferase MocA
VSVAAVVLAAGGSRRFGDAPKLLASFRGRPLVRWALDAAAGAGLDETVVVTGAVELSEALPPEATVLENPSWRDGLARSLGVALDWCSRQEHEAAVVGLGDQPFVSASSWRAVARSGAPLAVATYGGRRGHPVRLDSSVWHLLDLTGDEGARSLMARRPELVAEVACEGDPVDIDTMEELERWS